MVIKFPYRAGVRYFHDAVWRAGTQRRNSLRQAAHGKRVKAVHILGRINALNNRVRFDVIRQRQLHEDAIHRHIGIQRVNEIQQFVRRGPVGQIVGHPSRVQVRAAEALDQSLELVGKKAGTTWLITGHADGAIGVYEITVL